MLRWRLAAAALAVAFAIPLWINHSERRSQREAMEMDAQLLEEVNASVSRWAPASLEPLMQLIACEPDTAAQY
jgi:Flp pilus assembly protein TadB